MSHLDDLIEEFDGEEGMFYLGPEIQAEIRGLRERVVELEKDVVDDSGGYNSWGCD